MNYDYIYSIISLYLKNEKEDNKTQLMIIKRKDKIIFRFSMKKEAQEQTTFDLPLEEFSNYLDSIIKKYKSNLLVIDEKYEMDSQKKNCLYSLKFSNGRILSFYNFNVLEINNIRNNIFSIDTRPNEIRIKEEKETVSMNYKPRLQETGFISSSIFLIVLYLTDLLVISLWIFKSLIIS